MTPYGGQLMKVSSLRPRRTRSRVVVGALALFTLGTLSLTESLSAQSTQSPESIRFAAEESGYARHTRHAELLDYLRALRAASPEMYLGFYGETFQGRDRKSTRLNSSHVASSSAVFFF